MTVCPARIDRKLGTPRPMRWAHEDDVWTPKACQSVADAVSMVCHHEGAGLRRHVIHVEQASWQTQSLADDDLRASSAAAAVNLDGPCELPAFEVVSRGVQHRVHPPLQGGERRLLEDSGMRSRIVHLGNCAAGSVISQSEHQHQGCIPLACCLASLPVEGHRRGWPHFCELWLWPGQQHCATSLGSKRLRGMYVGMALAVM
eukprot:3294070-Lingulodinium_polyedra.AAC.1